jgi:hypothetical protein
LIQSKAAFFSTEPATPRQVDLLRRLMRQPCVARANEAPHFRPGRSRLMPHRQSGHADQGPGGLVDRPVARQARGAARPQSGQGSHVCCRGKLTKGGVGAAGANPRRPVDNAENAGLKYGTPPVNLPLYRIHPLVSRPKRDRGCFNRQPGTGRIRSIVTHTGGLAPGCLRVVRVALADLAHAAAKPA